MIFENTLNFVKHQIKKISQRIDLEEADMFRIADFLEELSDYIFVMTPELSEDFDDDVVCGKKYINHFRIGLGACFSKEDFEDSRIENLSQARQSLDFENIKDYLTHEFLYQNI